MLRRPLAAFVGRCSPARAVRNTINLPAIEQDYSNTNSYTPMLNTATIQSMLWCRRSTTQPARQRSQPPCLLFAESGVQRYWRPLFE